MRNVFGEFQPVGAGHGNAGVLQRLDDGVEKVAAAPHQHQHVAIGKAATIAEASGHGAAGDEPPDLAWMRFDSLTSALVTGTPSNGARQPSMSCFSSATESSQRSI